jgi:thioredoxin reductase (NADPH)
MAEQQDAPIKRGTNTNPHDLAIIGAGPAALSAAIYTCREDIDTLLIEKGAIGGLGG